MTAIDVASSLSTFDNTKFYIHSQKEEFFKRGITVRSTLSGDDVKAEEDGRATRVGDPTMTLASGTVVDVNPLELEADIAHFKVYPSSAVADCRNTSPI
jgi:hypothetical protein